MNIFISYSSHDYDLACEVCDYIEGKGETCFLAPRNIRTGFSYAEEILRGIDEADALILLLSANSNESQHVLREVERAVNAGVPIITYKISQVELSKSLEYFLMPFQWLEMNSAHDYRPLYNGLSALLGKEKPGNRDVSKQDNSEKNKKSNPWKFGMIAVGIMLVAAVCIIVVLAVNSNKNNSVLNAYNSSIYVNGSSENNDENTSSSGDTSAVNSMVDENGQAAAVNPEDYYVGMKVYFGSYYDEPIEWRILEIGEGGIAELITSNVIMMKCFDSAESGIALKTVDGRCFLDEQIYGDTEFTEGYGSSRWATSNLRTWLNSASANVVYADQKPTWQSVSDSKNAYGNEAGFLTNFSAAEREAIVQSSNRTGYYELETGNINGVDITEDYVYLLSDDELWKLDAANVPITVRPTNKAIENDESFFYQTESLTYNINEIAWWLRGAATAPATVVCVFNTGFDENMKMGYFPFVDGVGVRPVIKVRINSGLLNIIK